MVTQAEWISTTCPDDCSSVCALQVERIDGRTIGRVRGASAHAYTAGVICAKVARYAERVHHPDRLRTPLRRVGGKGIGFSEFQPISWDDALDEVAQRFQRAVERYGSEKGWPYFYARTTGLRQRGRIHRVRPPPQHSPQHKTLRAAPSQSVNLARAR